MNYIWGPLRGGSERSVSDHYMSCDQPGAERLLSLFHDWRRENRKKPDSFTLQAIINEIAVGPSPTETITKVTAVSFQSKEGSGSDNAVMHIHLTSGPMIIVPNVTVQRDKQNQITLMQLVPAP